jgi:hypothetical protein
MPFIKHKINAIILMQSLHSWLDCASATHLTCKL